MGCWRSYISQVILQGHYLNRHELHKGKNTLSYFKLYYKVISCKGSKDRGFTHKGERFCYRACQTCLLGLLGILGRILFKSLIFPFHHMSLRQINLTIKINHHSYRKEKWWEELLWRISIHPKKTRKQRAKGGELGRNMWLPGQVPSTHLTKSHLLTANQLYTHWKTNPLTSIPLPWSKYLSLLGDTPY